MSRHLKYIYCTWSIYTVPEVYIYCTWSIYTVPEKKEDRQNFNLSYNLPTWIKIKQPKKLILQNPKPLFKEHPHIRRRNVGADKQPNTQTIWFSKVAEKDLQKMVDVLRPGGCIVSWQEWQTPRSASSAHMPGCRVLPAATATANERVWNADARVTSLTHYQFLSACDGLIGLLLYNV